MVTNFVKSIVLAGLSFVSISLVHSATPAIAQTQQRGKIPEYIVNPYGEVYKIDKHPLRGGSIKDSEGRCFTKVYDGFVLKACSASLASSFYFEVKEGKIFIYDNAKDKPELAYVWDLDYKPKPGAMDAFKATTHNKSNSL